MAAVDSQGLALRHADHASRSDRSLALRAATRDVRTLAYVGEGLTGDRSFALEAAPSHLTHSHHSCGHRFGMLPVVEGLLVAPVLSCYRL